MGTRLSVMGGADATDSSDMAPILYMPFSIGQFARFGSSVSVCGIARFGSTLSVLDFFPIGSSVSLRSFSRLGETVSVLQLSSLGSSLSLRSFSRVGASMSLFGILRKATNSFVSDDSAVGDGSILKFPSWTVAYDSVNTKYAFTADGQAGPSWSISSDGGSLHGTWSADHIISASDRRLKRGIKPLHTSLLSKAKEELGMKQSSSPQLDGLSSASWLLRELQPRRWALPVKAESLAAKNQTSSHRIGFVAEEVERILPDLVRVAPDGTKQITYQDFIALIAQAAKERQTQLETEDNREAEELALIDQQDQEIDELEYHLDGLRKRFTRLRQKSLAPPFAA